MLTTCASSSVNMFGRTFQTSPARRGSVVVQATRGPAAEQHSTVKSALSAAAALVLLATPLASNAIDVPHKPSVVFELAADTGTERARLQETIGDGSGESQAAMAENPTDSNPRDTPFKRKESFQPFVPEPLKAQREAEFKQTLGTKGSGDKIAGQKDADTNTNVRQ